MRTFVYEYVVPGGDRKRAKLSVAPKLIAHCGNVVSSGVPPHPELTRKLIPPVVVGDTQTRDFATVVPYCIVSAASETLAVCTLCVALPVLSSVSSATGDGVPAGDREIRKRSEPEFKIVTHEGFVASS